MQKDNPPRDSETNDDTQTNTDALQLNIPPTELVDDTKSGTGSQSPSNSEAPSQASPAPDEASSSVDPIADVTPESSAASAKGKTAVSAKVTPPRSRQSRWPWFGLFNLLLILILGGVGSYDWYLRQQAALEDEATIRNLQNQINTKAGQVQVADEIEPIYQSMDQYTRQIQQLEKDQAALQQASEKLYEFYGRDKNGWQLAEVEYLMRVAQHKLVLQDDFAGAAVTLQAASDLIGATGDPGLIPVRVTISEEIADLRTRKRADLVGMTLILAQLSREALTLHPGFPYRADRSVDIPAQTDVPDEANEQTWLERIGTYMDSLVEIRHESLPPSHPEANIANVGQALSDNLKLARWSVLERDAFHYDMLLTRSVRLFREYYDPDDAANADFLQQLTDLQTRVLKPEKPDITGSLLQMQRILQQREADPVKAEEANID